jgi:hypothetical protein
MLRGVFRGFAVLTPEGFGLYVFFIEDFYDVVHQFPGLVLGHAQLLLSDFWELHSERKELLALGIGFLGDVELEDPRLTDFQFVQRVDVRVEVCE